MKAAEQGDDSGQYAVGMALYYGRGTRMDHVAAKQWLEAAAAQGNKEAAEMLKKE